MDANADMGSGGEDDYQPIAVTGLRESAVVKCSCGVTFNALPNSPNEVSMTTTCPFCAIFQSCQSLDLGCLTIFLSPKNLKEGVRIIHSPLVKIWADMSENNMPLLPVQMLSARHDFYLKGSDYFYRHAEYRIKDFMPRSMYVSIPHGKDKRRIIADISPEEGVPFDFYVTVIWISYCRLWTEEDPLYPVPRKEGLPAPGWVFGMLRKYALTYHRERYGNGGVISDGPVTDKAMEFWTKCIVLRRDIEHGMIAFAREVLLSEEQKLSPEIGHPLRKLSKKG